MKAYKTSRAGRVLLIGLVASFCLTILCLSFRLLLPSFLSSNYYQRNLHQLRHKAQKIKTEFAEVMDEMQLKKDLLHSTEFPLNNNEIFALFQKTASDPEIEGVSFYSRGTLTLWFGRIIDIQNIFFDSEGNLSPEFSQSSHLLREKASVYLVDIHRVDRDRFLVLFRLLAFLPEIKASYLHDYHFLNNRLLKNCSLEYWDFREDVSGFESLFKRNNDEYLGQPRLPDDVQTLIFPLRNREQKIVATVSLNSPSLISKTSQTKEDLLLIFFLSSIMTLVLLSVYMARFSPFFRKKRGWLFVSVIIILIGLRMLLILLSNSSRIQSLAVFSPSSASFISIGEFTKSPADIFLSAVFLFFIIGHIFLQTKPLLQRASNKKLPFVPFVLSFTAFAAVISLLIVFQILLFRLVFHSNLNLMSFDISASFVLLHLSVVLFFLSLFLSCMVIMRATVRLVSRPASLVLPFIISFILAFLFVKQNNLVFLMQALLAALVVFLSLYPQQARRKRIISLAFLLATVFLFVSIQTADQTRDRSMIESAPQNIIRSQKNWGIFLTEQSLPELDKESEVIRSFFLQPEPFDLAQSLWQETYLAKLNMYSSLIMMDPEGDFLSSFSLNVPEVYFSDLELPPSEEWQLFRENISFLGKEKDFLIASKDWYEENMVIGKTVLIVSIDYESLPFLYTANPYFEVLRATSIPSLNQIDLGFAVFDMDGKLVFNPHNISTGIPPKVLQKILSEDSPVWSSFNDKNRSYNSLYFTEQDRIYSLFVPRGNLIKFLTDLLKLLFLYLTLFLGTSFLVSLIVSGERLKKIFWSFSNRVYISFVLVALLPLLIFTISTQNFFNRTFEQQMNEKAEIHAEFAQRVMEDYIYLEQEEEASMILPPDEIVMWISSTISNDVNLYLEGKLISSSRREFFDSGLLPEIINGETFYKIHHENKPFFTQVQKIGDYSFNTLTIPYSFLESQLLISLPFPFEEQEISQATTELLEFLFLISVFFILAVILFARGIGGMIITPIKKLLSGTQQVSLGNLEFSIEYNQQDEMKTLINGFNKMVSDLKAHQQELAEMSKKVAWAEMARKVAHEVKNPLTPIQLSAEHLLQVYEEDRKNLGKALKESTSYIIHEVENLRKIAHEFMEISTESVIQEDIFDLNETVASVVSQYKTILSHRIRFQESYPDQSIRFHGDKAKIITALRNLITNAIEAIPEKGVIEVSLKTDRTSSAQILITDTGIGIGQDDIDRIFDTFFSTKEIGTGLGLPIAKKIIEDHEGSLKVTSRKNEGTRILIKLPLTSDPAGKNKSIPDGKHD